MPKSTPRQPCTGQPSVMVLMGGPDAEREVSINSGREVAAALRETGRYQVSDHLIDRPSIEDLQTLVESCDADIIFPVLHGRWGEGGPLQQLLEDVGLPYVGSRPRAAELAMDKLRTKQLVSALGVQTPAAEEVEHPHASRTIQPPLVLKPVDDGSSVHLRICHDAQTVQDALNDIFSLRRGGRVMAEQYIHGREITVGIVLDQPLPLIEIIPATEFYDYHAKYDRDDTRYIVNPELPPGVAEQCTSMAMTTWRALKPLGICDLARVDIMVDTRQPCGAWFLEINTMPGFTTHSLVPMAARKIGLSMPDLCARLVEAALTRPGSNQPADPSVMHDFTLGHAVGR